MENVKSDQQPSALPRLWRKAWSPLLSAIRQDIWGPAHQGLLDETRRILRALMERRRAAKERGSVALTETFESVVRRQGCTEEQLQQALTSYLRVHWAMYALAGACLVYAFWLALNANVLSAATTCIAVVGATVPGYVYGYRAWQIRHRRLRTLPDALSDLGTYLVL